MLPNLVLKYNEIVSLTNVFYTFSPLNLHFCSIHVLLFLFSKSSNIPYLYRYFHKICHYSGSVENLTRSIIIFFSSSYYCTTIRDLHTAYHSTYNSHSEIGPSWCMYVTMSTWYELARQKPLPPLTYQEGMLPFLNLPREFLEWYSKYKTIVSKMLGSRHTGRN
jgi:hypothetical protein